MLSVEEARERILAAMAPLPAESIPLTAALGRILAQDAVAAGPVPPFANSAMDGYALRSADTVRATGDAPRALRLVGEAAAGRLFTGILGEGEAVRILTGAPVPEGADAVLQQENVTVEGNWVHIPEVVGQGNNIRYPGEDVRPGTVLVGAGSEIGPAETALLAAAGVSPVRVSRRPRVAIVSTGDELVPLGEPLGPGQIYESNAPYLIAAVTRAGGEPWPLGVARDTEADLRAKLAEAESADLVLTSGGVSVGDYDLVKQLLTERGDMNFWRVRMRPGKPLAFGHLGKTPVLGLPGNPVSAAVTFELFGRPALRTMLGARSVLRPTVEVVLEGPAIPRGDRRHFVRVHLRGDGGRLVALPTGNQGSHLISSLQGASALLVVEEGEGAVQPGSLAPALLLNDAMPWSN